MCRQVTRPASTGYCPDSSSRPAAEVKSSTATVTPVQDIKRESAHSSFSESSVGCYVLRKSFATCDCQRSHFRRSYCSSASLIYCTARGAFRNTEHCFSAVYRCFFCCTLRVFSHDICIYLVWPVVCVCFLFIQACEGEGGSGLIAHTHPDVK